MAKIFISYAREDRPKAQQLARVFEDRGWSVWWDTRLKAGEVWDEVIERELTAAQCVVVLWSQVSIGKHWVRVEAHDGLQRGILIPALIDDVRPPLAFRLVQAEFLIGWSGDRSHPGLVRLLAAVGDRLASGNPEPEPHLPPLPIPDFAVFRDIDAPWCPEMVALPAGTFLMGSPQSEKERDHNEGPQHRVTIGTRFAIGRYPVTFAEYDQFCDVMKREKPEDNGWGRGRHPVIDVSWHDAQAYVAWLAKETGKHYRLPSEAEWEYGARAGTTKRYAFGNEITERDANFGGNVGKTTEVGAYPANPWGLYDMHGNVLEWVEDIWHDSYQSAPADGLAWTDSEGKNSSRYRVVRGGSWNLNPRNPRAAVRVRGDPESRRPFLGFRVARTLN
jgi:formylglycine-generating enzyme required for sulfatase activity